MKQFIKNRDNNDISVVIEGPETPGKLAFVAHGLSGYKEELQIRSMVAAFLATGYTVVSYDTVHTFGESKGGKYEDATITNYYADLQDVIAWAGSQLWYSEPFVLCGHSLGGISVALYAEGHPEKVKGLAPIATVVSGKLSLETPKYSSGLEEWKKAGVRIQKNSDGTEKRLKWSHLEDRLRYDLLTDASKLTMPVLMVVGSEDNATPPKHQQILFDALPAQKELHVIDGSVHTFDRLADRQELEAFIKSWAEKL